MKKHWLLPCLLVFLILVSCKKPVENTATELKVSKIVFKDLNDLTDSVVFTFDYSVDKEIIIKCLYAENDYTRTIYRFDDQARVSEIQLKNATDILLYQTTFTYNNNTAICLRIDHTTTIPYAEDSIVYSLGNDGFPIQATHYSDPEFGWSPDMIYHYYWQNGDLLRVVKEYSSIHDTTELTYENGLNPLKFCNLPLAFPEEGDDAFLLCNQHLTMNWMEGNEFIIKTESVEYNSDNYPVNIVKNLPGFSGEKFEYRLEYIPK